MSVRNIIVFMLAATLVSGVVLYSCTRKKVDYLGPEYLSAPDGFVAANLSVTNPVNFSGAGVCHISANFSNRVTYYITITGQQSGAVKKYTGVSDKIDDNTPGGIWNGSHDGLFFFRTGETVDVVITFLRSDVTLGGTTTINVARNPVTGNTNLYALGTTASNSYEAANVVPGNFPVQFAFSEAVIDANKYVERIQTSTIGVKSIQGLYSLRIAGKSAQPDGFFVGGIQHRQGFQTTANAFMLPTSWTDPSQIYFNVYIYGNGNSNATVNLEFHESDFDNPHNDRVLPKDTLKFEGCGGTQQLNQYGHDPCTDDGWVYAVPVNFTGWKLVSVKYNDFSRSVSIPNGGSGNGIKEPTRVARIQMGVVSNPAFKVADVMFDYPVISYGAPFDPSK